jgi:hypothetical protein
MLVKQPILDYFLLNVCLSLSKPLCIENIRNIIFSWTPLLPYEPSQSVGAWCRKAFHRDADPCWLQCFPQLCQVGWASFGWWTILDKHGKLLSMKNPAALQFLTQTGAPHTYCHTPFKGTYIVRLAHSSSEWHTHTIHVSIVSKLENAVFNLSPLLHLGWLKWI